MRHCIGRLVGLPSSWAKGRSRGDGAVELLTAAATLNGYLAEDGQEAVEATIGSGLGGGEREDEIS